MNQIANNEDLLHAILRTDRCAFIQKVFHTLNPGIDYVSNWHIEAVAHNLAGIEDGDINRLLITQPPRSLKSIITSVAWVAWCLGHNPSKSFICISYSQDLAADLSAKFKLVIQSEWYRDLFPATIFTRLSEGETKTSRGGGRITTSIGGTLTGRGADVVIIDDPLKAEDAASVTARKRVIDWYQGTLMSRLNNQKHGAILVVMQRLHEDDLAGHILDRDSDQDTDQNIRDKEDADLKEAPLPKIWTHLNLPATAIEDQYIVLGPTKTHLRREGDILHPAREGKTELIRLKRELGSQRYCAQYQQNPIPLEGNLIKRDWFQIYTPEELILLHAQQYVRIIQSWDIAMSTTETADWSVCTTWIKDRSNHYLIDVLRIRRNFPELKRLVETHANKHGAKTILLERTGIGEPLFQDLWNKPPMGMPKPIGIKVKDCKIVRMEAQSAKVENGHVYLPKDALWLDTYLHELMAFPTSKYDDQVDSTSQYLNWAETTRSISSSAALPQLYVFGRNEDEDYWA